MILVRYYASSFSFASWVKMLLVSSKYGIILALSNFLGFVSIVFSLSEEDFKTLQEKSNIAIAMIGHQKWFCILGGLILFSVSVLWIIISYFIPIQQKQGRKRS